MRIEIDHYEAKIAAFIATHGVTRCPTMPACGYRGQAAQPLDLPDPIICDAFARKDIAA